MKKNTTKTALIFLFSIFCIYLIFEAVCYFKNTPSPTQKIPDSINKHYVTDKGWTYEEKKAMTDTCFLKSPSANLYPEIIAANCSCITEGISKKYTPMECERMGKLSMKERARILHDIIIACGQSSGFDTIRTRLESYKGK